MRVLLQAGKKLTSYPIKIKDCNLTVSSKYMFFQKLDQLPIRPGMKWIYDDVTVVGNIMGDDGKPKWERVELWRRNPVEVIRELIGNPAFQMAFAPKKVYSDRSKLNRIFDEMWTADWWWNLQVSTN